jgi:hypothetical protein
MQKLAPAAPPSRRAMKARRMGLLVIGPVPIADVDGKHLSSRILTLLFNLGSDKLEKIDSRTKVT